MSARPALKRGAVRLEYGVVGEHPKPSRDRQALAEAAQQAEALAAALHEASLGDGPVPGAVRFDVIAAAQDLAQRVRVVVVR